MGIKQHNRAIQRSYGPTRCEFHENCLSCPLSTCIEEMDQKDIQKLREERRRVLPTSVAEQISTLHKPVQDTVQDPVQDEEARQRAAQKIANYMGLKTPSSIYRSLRRIRMEPKDRSSQREMYVNEKTTVINRAPASYRYQMTCPHCQGVVVYPMRDDDTRYYLQALLKKSLGDSIVRQSWHTSCGLNVWLIISVSADLQLTAGLGVSPCDDREMRKPEPHDEQQILKIARRNRTPTNRNKDQNKNRASQYHQIEMNRQEQLCKTDTPATSETSESTDF